MDHTPTTAASDDRPIKLLDRTPVADEHKQRLFALVRRAQNVAADANVELQSEFGKEAVSLICSCNQFVRLYRAGLEPGCVELLVDDDVKAMLQEAGFTLRQPEGMIFKMFGWIRIDPMEGDMDRLEEAVESAFEKANQAGKPQGP